MIPAPHIILQTDMPSDHKFCSDYFACMSLIRPTLFAECLLPGFPFHFDFSFMHTSMQSYTKINGATIIDNLYDGHNLYLLITDTKTR